MEGATGAEAAPKSAALASRPAALVLLFVLNQGDILTTRWVLERGGHEGNPLASTLLSRSLDTLLFAKLILVAAIAIAAALCPPRHAERAAQWIWTAVLIYGLVVTWNCIQLFAYRLG